MPTVKFHKHTLPKCTSNNENSIIYNLSMQNEKKTISKVCFIKYYCLIILNPIKYLLVSQENLFSLFSKKLDPDPKKFKILKCNIKGDLSKNNSANRKADFDKKLIIDEKR